MQPYGDADDVIAIMAQAVNYTTSDILNTGTWLSPVYHFSAVALPMIGITATDLVYSFIH